MEEKEPNKNKKKKGADMKKGTRDTFDQREKDMFWNILRTRNAGQIWKILTESSSNQARHDTVIAFEKKNWATKTGSGFDFQDSVQ